MSGFSCQISPGFYCIIFAGIKLSNRQKKEIELVEAVSFSFVGVRNSGKCTRDWEKKHPPENYLSEKLLPGKMSQENCNFCSFLSFL